MDLPTRADISSTSAPPADTTEHPVSPTTALESLVSVFPVDTYISQLITGPTTALEGFTESLAKELVPAWNVKAMIIQPGGFETQWAKDLHQHPQPPAYSAPDSPTSQWRAMLASGLTGVGSPEKAAAALIKLSHVPPTELPTRIQFGTDCWAVVKAKAESVARDTVKWADVSHSTNNDGVDKDAIIGFASSLV